jgi:hypothetical protein
MLKTNSSEEKQDSEKDFKEQGHWLDSLGNAYRLEKEKKIKLIDEKQKTDEQRTPKIEDNISLVKTL